MRKAFIAGNWKMHGSLSMVKELVLHIQQGAHSCKGIDILLLPAFVHLPLVHSLIRQSRSTLLLGAQNLHAGSQGAFTGEVSGPMLKETGCEYVLTGHSERRILFHESNTLVAEKFRAAIQAGLKPILCVGETLAQREAGETERIIQDQLSAVVQFAGIDTFAHALIAYEPVWAIGTGQTATPDQAQAVHAFIRQQISQINVDIAETICILYGGSVKPDNAAALLAQPDIDGGLIGGASLNAASFLNICEAAEHFLCTR